ncbi:hypothetical protein IW137_004910, partial [Coemansia sp. RSA 1287]
MSKLPADIDRNNYSYMTRERHSADIDSSPAMDAEQPRAGQPFGFQNGMRDAMSASTFSLHAPSTRQSQASIPSDVAASTGLTHTVSHQPPSYGQAQSPVLKRAGSAVPHRLGKERIAGSSISITPVPSASKWFRRGRNRSSSKPKEPPTENHH